MDRNKKKRNKKIIIAVLCIAVSFTLFSVFVGKTPVEQMLSDSVNTVEYYVIKKPIEFLGGIVDEYNSLKDVYNENKELKKKLNKYASSQATINKLQKEIDKLKKAQDLSYLPSDYKTTNASVITRDATTWSQEITINVGSNSGIQEGMVVVNSKSMVGLVSKVSTTTANVTLLSAPNNTNQLPVMIENGNETIYGLLDSYDASSNRYSITLLTNADKLDKDAKVYTSGLGGKGKAPKGVYIGTAKSISSSDSGSGKIIKVKPGTSFDDLSYVSVVKKVN
ncbi:MAG: rod shape-determining protein MreC [Thomasclavelia sp.]|nr:rod shape-determining protein MreC [Thomasclavelia sp.]